MDDKGQMLVLEAVFFAIIVLSSLIFIYQITPLSGVSNKYTNNLKILGDSALQSLYAEVMTSQIWSGYLLGNYRFGLIEHYLISNSYGNFITDLNSMLPPSVLYNIYVSNGTKTEFWCSSIRDISEPLSPIDPISTSHCIVSIHPDLLTEILPKSQYDPGRTPDESDLDDMFEGYGDSTYDVILELWYI